MKATRLLLATALLAGAAFAAHTAIAQPGGLRRTDLVHQDLGVADHETIQARVDFPIGATAPAHRHPGEEIAHVLEGTLEYRIDDGAPIVLQAGQSVFIPAGAKHSARNVGTGAASELATYFLEKGKPLAVLAP